MNFIINENRKTRELIMNQFTILQNKFDQLSQNLKINNINNQQKLKWIKNGFNWRYVGQVVNGLKEGKGVCYWDVGDRYEGDFRNDKKEGKGIYYFNKDPFKGDRYEGDFKNDKYEGKGIYYFNNGDRIMGEFYNDNPIGKHETLTRNGEVKINNY